MKTTMQNSMFEFFKYNRRQGSSTALLRTAQEEGGIIVVDTLATVKWMTEWAKMLFGENTPINFKVITVHQIKNGVDRGLEPQKVFIDTSAFWPLLKAGGLGGEEPAFHAVAH